MYPNSTMRSPHRYQYPYLTKRYRIRIKNQATQYLNRFLHTRKVNVAIRAFRCWAEKFLRFGPSPTYKKLGRVRDEHRAQVVPKGHVAIYVGAKEEGVAAERMVVPLVYVNHPMFARLLRVAEEKYGFDHPGGITIPCHVSEFHSVKSLIAGKYYHS